MRLPAVLFCASQSNNGTKYRKFPRKLKNLMILAMLDGQKRRPPEDEGREFVFRCSEAWRWVNSVLLTINILQTVYSGTLGKLWANLSEQNWSSERTVFIVFQQSLLCHNIKKYLVPVITSGHFFTTFSRQRRPRKKQWRKQRSTRSCWSRVAR